MAYANISDALRAFDEATGQREELLGFIDRNGGWTTATLNKFLANPVEAAKGLNFRVTEKKPAPPPPQPQQSQISADEEKRLTDEFYRQMQGQGFSNAQAASLVGDFIGGIKGGKSVFQSMQDVAAKNPAPAQPTVQGTPDSPGAVFTPSQPPTGQQPAKTGEEGARAAFDSGGFSELLKFLEANKTQPAPQQPPAQPAQPIAEAVVKTPGQYGGYQSAEEQKLASEFFGQITGQGYSPAQAASMVGEHVQNMRNGKTQFESFLEVSNKYPQQKAEAPKVEAPVTPTPAAPPSGQYGGYKSADEQKLATDFYSQVTGQGYSPAQAASMVGEYVNGIRGGKTQFESFLEVSNKYPQTVAKEQPVQPPVAPEKVEYSDKYLGANKAFEEGGFDAFLKYIDGNKETPGGQPPVQPPVQPPPTGTQPPAGTTGTEAGANDAFASGGFQGFLEYIQKNRTDTGQPPAQPPGQVQPPITPNPQPPGITQPPVQPPTSPPTQPPTAPTGDVFNKFLGNANAITGAPALNTAEQPDFNALISQANTGNTLTGPGSSTLTARKTALEGASINVDAAIADSDAEVEGLYNKSAKDLSRALRLTPGGADSGQGITQFENLSASANQQKLQQRTQIRNKAADQNLAIFQATEASRQFDVSSAESARQFSINNATQRDQFAKTYNLDAARLNEQAREFNLGTAERMTQYAETLGLDNEKFLEAKRQFDVNDVMRNKEFDETMRQFNEENKLKEAELFGGAPSFTTTYEDFQSAFNKQRGDTGYNPTYDFDGDGVVGYPDFLEYTANSVDIGNGKRYYTPPGPRTVAAQQLDQAKIEALQRFDLDSKTLDSAIAQQEKTFQETQRQYNSNFSGYLLEYGDDGKLAIERDPTTGQVTALESMEKQAFDDQQAQNIAAFNRNFNTNINTFVQQLTGRTAASADKFVEGLSDEEELEVMKLIMGIAYNQPVSAGSFLQPEDNSLGVAAITAAGQVLGNVAGNITKPKTTKTG